MIKEFLIDNYIWILVVILLTIVTIIGFLVDKNKNKKKEAEPTPQNPVPGPTLNPIPAGMNNGMPYNNGQMMNQGPMQNPTPMMNNQPQNMPNNGVQMSEPYKNPVQTPVLMPGEGPVNPQPVENISMNQMTEPMYQPLSEQTPHFPQQQPVNIPTPVNNPLPVQPVGMNYNQQMNPQMQPMNQMPNNGQPQMIPNPMGNAPMPNPMPNNGMNNTIPTPINNQVNGMNNGYVYNPQNNNQM